MSAQDEIRSALESGEAVLRYHVIDEAYYAETATAGRSDRITVEFGVGIDAVDGGTFGEWTAENIRHIGMQHHVFSDGADAFGVAIERGYLRALAAETPAEFRAALEEVGFRDLTKRSAPRLVTTPTMPLEETR